MPRTTTMVAIREVPAVLNHAGGVAIPKGTTVRVARVIFFNGEHWVVFPDGGKAPAIFFDDAQEGA